MALFGKSKSEEKASAAAVTASGSLVLKSPRITEKAARVTEQGAYVFNVMPKATKRDIAAAVVALYKVTPRKINVVNVSKRRVLSRARGMRGTVAGYRKAYVYLKKGDSIELL